MPLTNERKKELRAIGHALNPVVTVAGGGLSDGVLAEISRALDDHELIKIKIAVGDRALKQQTISELCEKSQAELVQTIGNIALVLRPAKKPNPQLSNLKRVKKL
jgi:RNA-binding protein